MAAPQAGGQPDNSSSLLWGVAALFFALGAIWFGFKDELIHFYLSVKLYELHFIEHIMGVVGYHSPDFQELESTLVQAKSNPNSIDFQTAINLGVAVGKWIRIPIFIILFILAIVVYLGNTACIYKNIYSMRSFMQIEQENWPQISPVANLDLLKVDIDTGPWAMAMTPLQFCKRYKLLNEVRLQRGEGVSRKERNRIDVVLKRGEANKIFAMQLGPLWSGSSALPPHTKALFAVFAARINADSKIAAEILLQLNMSSLGTLNLAGVDDLLKKHEGSKLVQKVLHSHAYVSTVMAAMLEGARDDGVQASADFLWLKPVDRKLWYTLNVVGRQTPFIEVAGIFAHWIAEREADRKLLVPMVEEATHAVEIALKEVIYHPDE